MNLSEAWVVLGHDVSQILHSISRLPDVRSKMKAVDGAHRLAERTAKKLLGQSHPDLNPGNLEAAKRYMEVLEARDVIRKHTEEFRKKAEAFFDRKENPPNGHIRIG